MLYFSLPLAALVTVASCAGLWTPNFYSQETPNWQIQSLGQDAVDLFLLVPCLLITSLLAYRKSNSAKLLWGGIVLYLVYTFLIYCFDVHFNGMFLVYCFALGLSVFASLYFLHEQVKNSAKHTFTSNASVKTIGIYFIFVAVVFYFLWLSEIIPAILHHVTPKSLSEVGLPTNAVHVIDLSVFLPAIFIVGISLLRKKTGMIFLVPVLLTFFVVMDITIGTLVVVMKMKNLTGDLSVAMIMAVFTLVSLFLLIWFFISQRKIS